MYMGPARHASLAGPPCLPGQPGPGTTFTVTGSFSSRHFAAGVDAISPSYLWVSIS